MPSMTSLEWKPGNSYGTDRAPRYAALSYTWGRWKILNDQGSPLPALDVQGTSWKIPPVRESLFTVAEFETVIKTITREAECNFVWLDIACIDQNPGSAQAASEIGKQIKIFRSAYQTFIWLASDKGIAKRDSTQSLLHG